MGLRHQEDVQPGSSRDTPSAGNTSFSGRVLARLMWAQASTRRAETQQPHGLLVSSSQDSGWGVGRDGQTSIEHGLRGRPGEAPTFCVTAPKWPRTQRWANPMLSADTHVSGKDLRARGCHGHTDSTRSFSRGTEHGEKTQTHHLLREGTRLSGKKANSRSGQDRHNVTLEILSSASKPGGSHQKDPGATEDSPTDQSWDKFNISKNNNSNTPKHKRLNP